MNYDYQQVAQVFRTILEVKLLKKVSKQKAAEQAYSDILSVFSLDLLTEEEKEDLKGRIYLENKISFDFDNTVFSLHDKAIEDWYNPTKKITFFFWNRYKNYLIEKKKWDIEILNSIDVTTDKIMSFLGNPNDNNPFDKRGLVLGYVQSGKTANFTGLINKAFDSGYKLIIVLAGIHNDLRQQTQIRLEEEVVGIRLNNGKKTGVSEIVGNKKGKIVGMWTTEDRDVSKASIRVTHLDNMTLMVVKKNKTVLEALIDQLINQKKLNNLDVPVLIIDDEADQASVNTAKQSKEEDPKTINLLIRRLMEVFPRRNYVGYTATPFANLLIDSEANHEKGGNDLYPKDFLVGLPKPMDYCGPEEFFNVYEDADYRKPSLIKYISTSENTLLGSIKKTEDAISFKKVPESMHNAILNFIITIGIRNLRGQSKKHNSMLIHLSRLKGVQNQVRDVIAKEFENVKDSILNDNKSLEIIKMKRIFNNEINPTSSEWDNNIELFSWKEVLSEIKKVIESIQILGINGDSKDSLDYFSYDRGLNVIAIGGDKLSRGLTLEGLTITYYTRNTVMYDTLMQMGRWFGYRKGYIDLCRIYTTENIAKNFEDLAIAMVKIREEFEFLSRSSKTPKEYAIRMLSHETMKLTSVLKMQNAAKYNIRLEASLQQTRLFDVNKEFYQKNVQATVNLIDNKQFETFADNETKYHIARNISFIDIINFLYSYQTSSQATKVQSAQIANYIQIVNQKNELSNWTIAIVEGSSRNNNVQNHKINLGEFQNINTVMRGENAHLTWKDNGALDIKAIVAGNQEFIDIDPSKINTKMNKVQKRAKREPSEGLLLIYPLNPNVEIFKKVNVEFNEKLFPIGIALSFPKSHIDDDGIYLINKTI